MVLLGRGGSYMEKGEDIGGNSWFMDLFMLCLGGLEIIYREGKDEMRKEK